MIKSIIEGEKPEYEYPMLMVMNDYPEEVVLFVSDKCGTLVSSSNDFDLKVGDYSNNWAISQFRIFDSIVLISNK